MSALVIVDLQNDFLPGGSLGVPNGDEVIAVINRLQKKNFDLIVATKDWHPIGHISFASSHPAKEPGDRVAVEGFPQTLWPDHCIQNTLGAEFSKNLSQEKITKIFHKGTDPKIDSYSAFFDNLHAKSTGLGEYLKGMGIGKVYLAGLTTDYCVKFSALDALSHGFETYVIVDACRPVNLESGDEAAAFREMERGGAHLVREEDL